MIIYYRLDQEETMDLILTKTIAIKWEFLEDLLKNRDY